MRGDPPLPHHSLQATPTPPPTASKMFFVKALEHRIDLHPSFFSSTAHDFIKAKLYQDVEGTNTGTHMIIAVLQIDDISEPKIAPGTGFAQYNVGYRALVWRPFKGEVVDGRVTQVVHNGFFVDVGGLNVFVSKTVGSFPYPLGFGAWMEWWMRKHGESTTSSHTNSSSGY